MTGRDDEWEPGPNTIRLGYRVEVRDETGELVEVFSVPTKPEGLLRRTHATNFLGGYVTVTPIDWAVPL